ncbi:hypothetical protein HYX12_02015 [Candidatus Woesearchaeota archaeon]|nr:hypothetical protein [Candidatus Woesearchaeota archaeon]
MTKGPILVLDDEPGFLQQTVQQLEHNLFLPFSFGDIKETLEDIRRGTKYIALITDFYRTGEDIISEFHTRLPTARILVYSEWQVRNLGVPYVNVSKEPSRDNLFRELKRQGIEPFASYDEQWAWIDSQKM